MWRVFTKAGQPGWAVFIPIYNTIVLLRVAGKPWWWLLLFLIPVVDIVLAIIVYASVATNFGKGGRLRSGTHLPALHLHPDPRLWRGHLPNPSPGADDALHKMRK